MKLVLLSDTHTLHERIDVPEGDVLIHAGDFSGHGSLAEAGAFLHWFGQQPHTHKIVIAGNHDWAAQREHYRFRALVPDGVTYLQDAATVIDGVKFYGMPWQPEFYDWAFNLPRNGWEMAQKVAAIPDDTHVLITHGPPFGILDRVGTMPQGCDLLTERLSYLPKLQLHVFGHIHEGAGRMERNGVEFINAAICTRQYEPKHVVQTFTLSHAA